MSLDKLALLEIFKPKIIDSVVPGVGPVRLRELSAPEVSDIREVCKAGKNEAEFGFRLVIAALVDDEDKPVFTADDLDTMRAASQRSIGALVVKVMEINGFTLKGDAEKN